MGRCVVECVWVKYGVYIVVCAMCLCACSVHKRVVEVSAKLERMYEDTKEWRELPERRITWHQALVMMRAENLELADMQDMIEQSERRSLSVYTDMIPGFSYGGYMSRALADLVQPMSSEELRSHVNVSFSLPTLTRVPYDVYSAKASTYALIKGKEGKERELVSRLYRLVRKRQVEEAKQRLMARAPEREAGGDEPAQRKAASRQAEERYWQEVSEILGKRNMRWTIDPGSMPRVSWEEYNPRLDYLGELVVCKLALQLERARLLQYDSAMYYLPTINMSLYSPALFNSSGGTYGGTFLDAHDTTLSLNISYALDTKLSHWNSYQRSKASYEREKVRVADALVEHRNKIRMLRDSMEEYMNWCSYMRKHMAYLRGMPTQTAEEYIEREKLLYSMEMELLNQEDTSIEAEAAVVLEYGMPDDPEAKRQQSRR